jgi:type IX secretion system PorP/SprF family membrane protein
MRRYFTFIISFIALIGYTTSLKAQDPRFSQFYASPLELNPAMIGVYEGSWRFIANYRDAYSSILQDNAFRTFAASFDMRQPVQRKGDHFGFGISVLRDEAGEGDFVRTKANAGASFLKKLGGSGYNPYDQYLVAGAQIGFGQHNLNWQKLWFSNQFDESSGGINFNQDTGEVFDRESTDLYLDFNAGLLWYILFDDNLSFYAGGAFHHLNSPNVSFIQNSDETLHRRWVANAGGEIPLSREISILPAAAVMGQNQHLSIAAGGNIRYSNRDWREVAIRAGAWAHLSNSLDNGIAMDAIVFTTFLEMEKWNVGISYDVTTSVLRTANNSRGAFELSFIYVHPSRSRYDVRCPNF